MPNNAEKVKLDKQLNFKQQLKVLLKKEIIDLEALASLLYEEKETLKTRNSKQIELIAQNKSLQVEQLESRAKIKAKLMAESGLDIKPGEVEQKLNTLHDEELMGLWQSSRSKLNECKENNLVNGNILTHSLQRTNKLMMIVRGQNKSQKLYGQQGKEQSYAGSHRIGKA